MVHPCSEYSWMMISLWLDKVDFFFGWGGVCCGCRLGHTASTFKYTLFLLSITPYTLLFMNKIMPFRPSLSVKEMGGFIGGSEVKSQWEKMFAYIHKKVPNVSSKIYCLS